MLKDKLLVLAALFGASGVLTPAGVGAQSLPDWLSIHGSATLAAGQSADLGVAGLADEPTLDYRTMALQFRLALSSADNVVVQVGHRHLGRSVLNQHEAPVFLDWGFYARRLPGQFAGRIGRVPIPRGLFNEIRDIGTLLPFFRAPLSFYTDGIESMEGATLSRSFDLADAWSLDVTGFYGGWDFVQVQPEAAQGGSMGGMSMNEPSMMVTDTRARHALGGQLWLSTPLSGVRLGFGGQRFTMGSEGLTGFFGMVHGEMDMGGMDGMDGMDGMGSMDGMDPMSAEGVQEDVPGFIWQASMEGIFDRFALRGEYEVFALEVVRYYAGYGQVGFRLTDRLSLNGQAEFARVHHAEGSMDMEFRFARDLAASLAFSLTRNVVLKAEGHTLSGHAFDTWVDPAGPPAESNYFIMSVSGVF